MFEDEAHSCIKRVVTDNPTIAAPHENATDNVLVPVLQRVLAHLKSRVHILASLLSHDLLELLLALGQHLLYQMLVLLPSFNIHCPLHHPQHPLNIVNQYLHYQLLQKLSVPALVLDHLLQPLLEQLSQLFYEFVSGLHFRDPLLVNDR